MAKNYKKYLSYKEAWSRIDRGLENGSHLEVVTICESIIADRLLSYVTRVNKDSKANTLTHFGNLIGEWERLTSDAPSPPIQFDGVPLTKAAKAWAKRRNNVVHGLVKSEPGTPTQSVDDFLKDAQETAQTGKRLARAVTNWHREQKRLSKGKS